MKFYAGFCDINYNETPGLADSFQLYGEGVTAADVVGADAEVNKYIFILIPGQAADDPHFCKFLYNCIINS